MDNLSSPNIFSRVDKGPMVEVIVYTYTRRQMKVGVFTRKEEKVVLTLERENVIGRVGTIV